MSEQNEERKIYYRVLGKRRPFASSRMSPDILEFLRQARDLNLIDNLFWRVQEEDMPEEIGEEEKADSLEKRLSIIEEKVINIEKHLQKGTENKMQALEQFKKMISDIPEVKRVFYRETEDGLDFWTLFESHDRFKTLQKIVKAQIELDKSYKEIFFDFNINHLADIDIEELENWEQLLAS